MIEHHENNGIRLAFEQFGSREDPAIVLVAGASSAMDWWDTEFCERLAAGGHRVIRYDLRDTGESTTVPLGEADYTGRDLLDDLVGLIEALELAPAHVVGLSLGGGLAMQLALRRPELLATITLMSTTAGGPGLPPPTPEMAASFESEPVMPDWSDPQAVGDYFVATERLFSGTVAVDERRIRTIAETVRARSIDMAAAANHWSLDGGEGMEGEAAEIRIPTLVLHGTDDPLFPIAHGEALARTIPGARFAPIAGMGHQNPPPPTWDFVIGEILRHTAGLPH